MGANDIFIINKNKSINMKQVRSFEVFEEEDRLKFFGVGLNGAEIVLLEIKGGARGKFEKVLEALDNFVKVVRL